MTRPAFSATFVGTTCLACVSALAAPRALAEPVPESLRIRVVGTASFQGRSTALIQDANTMSDSFYRVDDPVYGYRISEIRDDGVALVRAGHSYFLPLRPAAQAPAVLPGPGTALAATGPAAPLPANFYLEGPSGGGSTRWDLVAPGARGPGIGADLAGSPGRFAFPLREFKRLSSGFGYRNHPIRGGSRMHKGIDLSAASGTRILCADSGTVTSAGWRGGYGWCVVVDHHNGFETLYGHCSKLIADLGDNVRRGDYIADVGSTGASTGPHLHFEVHRNGAPIDPEPFFPDAL